MADEDDPFFIPPFLKLTEEQRRRARDRVKPVSPRADDPVQAMRDRVAKIKERRRIRSLKERVASLQEQVRLLEGRDIPASQRKKLEEALREAQTELYMAL